MIDWLGAHKVKHTQVYMQEHMLWVKVACNGTLFCGSPDCQPQESLKLWFGFPVGFVVSANSLTHYMHAM